MHLHEYQSKLILREYGINITPFAVVQTVNEATIAVNEMGLSSAVVKVQIHAGGRGKAGGVRIARTPDEIIEACEQLLGMKIVNAQTGPLGIITRQVMISPITEIQKEYYISLTIDRKRAQAILICSSEGGMEIEEIAITAPHQIKIIPISLQGTLRNYQILDIIKFLGWTGKTAEQGKELLKGLAQAFVEKDCTLLEINPLVRTPSGDLIALDAKMTIDDNATYRQLDIAAYDDLTQFGPNEVRAKESELAYVALDGEVGCMVNGAGLAMATMDIIHYYGGRAANFLDVGGSATEEKIAEGFKIILSDPNVKVVLVNIFGGIMNCVTLAAGIVAASTEQHVHVPLIVRMEGTNVDKGKKILEDSDLDILIAENLVDAAQKAIAVVKRG